MWKSTEHASSCKFGIRPDKNDSGPLPLPTFAELKAFCWCTMSRIVGVLNRFATGFRRFNSMRMSTSTKFSWETSATWLTKKSSARKKARAWPRNLVFRLRKSRPRQILPWTIVSRTWPRPSRIDCKPTDKGHPMLLDKRNCHSSQDKRKPSRDPSAVRKIRMELGCDGRKTQIHTTCLESDNNHTHTHTHTQKTRIGFASMDKDENDFDETQVKKGTIVHDTQLQCFDVFHCLDM
mmetsp:Transcript_13115/g.36291  ORF Transcript_13115/g.36291 Transcript_13115/m.36291 type:complete len:236 (-) Transcript_13115:75-782(-)